MTENKYQECTKCGILVQEDKEQADFVCIDCKPVKADKPRTALDLLIDVLAPI